jgi:hypothetical protein
VLYGVLISITLLAGASSSIGSLGATVAVEREYAKTLCGDDSTALRKLNASEFGAAGMTCSTSPRMSGTHHSLAAGRLCHLLQHAARSNQLTCDAL